MMKKIKPLEVILVLFILVLVFYNLPNFPLTWFDEGSHLHVPKTIVKYGEYADYSSDGFRYYGPTIGVGPTVMLPIAGMFSIFGIGMIQARIVIALYLLLTLFLFYRLSDNFGGWVFALIALVLVISSRSILMIETGRQVLGEVPGLFFIVAAFVLWFSNWSRPNYPKLLAVGALFGLAIITKYQYLLFLMPTLGLAWLGNLFYYKVTPQRTFIVPTGVAVLLFGIWQMYMLVYLGPATISENFALLRESAGSAAFNFSPTLIDQNLSVLISRSTFMGGLLPALLYGLFLIFPRREDGQKWGILYFLVLINLVWYVGFSIGWLRYAFLGLTFSTLFVAKFIFDLSGHLTIKVREIIERSFNKEILNRELILPAVVGIWAVMMVLIPMAKTTKDILLPPQNTAVQVAEYLDTNISKDVVIESWDPELGFLTDHSYHFPPTELLTKAIDHIYFEGPPVSAFYDYYVTNPPDYIVVGEFSAWVGIYDWDYLYMNYESLIRIGDYEIYAKNTR